MHDNNIILHYCYNCATRFVCYDSSKCNPTKLYDLLCMIKGALNKLIQTYYIRKYCMLLSRLDNCFTILQQKSITSIITILHA